MKNIKLIILAALLLLTGCESSSLLDENSLLPSEDVTSEGNSADPSSEPVISEDSSEESSEIVPLSDPDVLGLVRSEVWPSDAVSSFLSYADDILMPVLTSEVSFHHGLYDDELFYRVLTRTRSYNDFLSYKRILEDEYDFTFELEDNNFYYGASLYDEVRIHLEYSFNNNRHEVMFDFFDGAGDKYDGLKAVDNLATFNLRNQGAVRKKSPTSVKWEVRPATFTVYKGSAGYNVGGDNYSQLSNPLRFYAGQEASFAVSTKYKIVDLTILAASEYAQDTVDQGNFASAKKIVVDGDWINITPLDNINNIHYIRQNVTNVGQVRWLEIRITFTKA